MAASVQIMSPEILKIGLDPYRAFSRAKEVLSRGGVIVYPTDTFYALGVDPRNVEAVKRLYDIKGRGEHQPILLLIQSTSEVRKWAEEVTEQAERLMKRFWPGRLTIVFKANKEVLPILSAAKETIGLRVPDNDITLKLLEFLNISVTGTSANLSGGSSPSTIEELDHRLRDAVDLILDAGKTTGGSPSTVVDATTDRLTVIREGAVTIAECGLRNSE